MLDYNLINSKPTIKHNGITYQDLLASTFNKESYYNPTILVVNKYYVARPDLISLAVYGDDKYADVICKINGISNPFELNEDTVLMIPDVEFLDDCLNKIRISSDIINNAENEHIQKVNKNSRQKLKNDLRSPNEQVIGDSNYTIDKSLGIVFY